MREMTTDPISVRLIGEPKIADFIRDPRLLYPSELPFNPPASTTGTIIAHPVAKPTYHKSPQFEFNLSVH